MSDPNQARQSRIERLHEEAAQRILILDGAMGTMIQAHKFEEADYRGARFADHGQDLLGNNDLLTLTQPQAIKDIHKDYLDAGADIVETNTFNSTTVSQADYALENIVRELNCESARLARVACDEVEAGASGRLACVAGVLGPTNRTASISPDVNDPGFRNISFEELRQTYEEATHGLIEGGADLILVETIFDTLNAKAALYAIENVYEEIGFRLPIMISGTITDLSGRTLSGQTPEAFWYSVSHAQPFSVGFNCALGAKELRPHIEALGAVADCLVSAHPNAGLPNEFGGYDETPEMMGDFIEEFGTSGLVNIIGGCCGTTPDHIREFKKRLEGVTPRQVPELPARLSLSGLEAFVATA